jgi:hypothetical protein
LATLPRNHHALKGRSRDTRPGRLGCRNRARLVKRGGGSNVPDRLAAFSRYLRSATELGCEDCSLMLVRRHVTFDPTASTSFLPVRWKVRGLWAATLTVTAIGLVPLFSRYGSHDPRTLPGLLPALIGWSISLLWPRCPFCHERVIRSRLDWLAPPRDCPDCHQTYDGPFRSAGQLEARDRAEARRLLSKDSIDTPDDSDDPGSVARGA